MSRARLRVAFAGTPEFAAHALQAIIAAGFEVPLVLTQPDRRGGRGMQVKASAVKQLAQTHGIALDQPERLRSADEQQALRQCAADVLVVAAYGIILPQAGLDLPRLGCINIHASLLPRWRGAAPIHRAIEAGDALTGITIMQMDAGLDTGPMLLDESLPIGAEESTAELHDRLAALGGALVVRALHALAGEGLAAQPQPQAGVSYAHKITKAEAAIDWQRPAEQIGRAVRAFNPFPGAHTRFADQTVKIWRAQVVPGSARAGEVLSADAEGVVVACGRDALRCTELQKPGGKRLPAADFIRGFELAPGERFD